MNAPAADREPAWSDKQAAVLDAAGATDLLQQRANFFVQLAY